MSEIVADEQKMMGAASSSATAAALLLLLVILSAQVALLLPQMVRDITAMPPSIMLPRRRDMSLTMVTWPLLVWLEQRQQETIRMRLRLRSSSMMCQASRMVRWHREWRLVLSAEQQQ